MTHIFTNDIVAMILLIIAIYCGVNWLFIFIMYLTNQLGASEPEANQRAFQFGLILVIALGFYGLLLR